MYQQTHLVINFEEIFDKEDNNEDAPLTNIQNSVDHTVLEQAPKSMYKSQVILPRQPQLLQHNHSTASLTIMSTDNQNKQSYFEGASSFLQKYNSGSILSQANLKRKEKPSNQLVQQVTQRLTQPSVISKISCSKHSCKDGMIVKKNPVPKNKRQQIPNNRSLSEIKNVTEAFERLHNHSKFDYLKHRYIVKSNLSPSKPATASPSRVKQNSPYLTNYVPFYQRLDNEIHRSFEKTKIFEDGLSFSLKQGKQLFKPTLISSKYSKKVESRYRKVTTQPRQQSFLSQSFLNNSILDRSQEMMEEVERHFFNKMQCIFVEPDSHYIKISEKTIALLTEIQFEILGVFIMYLEENPIKTDEFLAYLSSYYQVHFPLL